jgi:hypothetical protein
LSLKQDVITGFSFSFTKALLDKLKKLMKEERLFEQHEGYFKKELTDIGMTVCRYLCDQLQNRCNPEDQTPENITELINTADEFLATFKK